MQVLVEPYAEVGKPFTYGRKGILCVESSRLTSITS